MSIGQRWLITGASSGLGCALASVVLDRGDTVIGTARDPVRLEPLQGRGGDRFTGLALDLTATSSIDRVADFASDVEGGIDVLVNNAGYGLIGAIEETDEDELRAVMQINFIGPALLTGRLVPQFRERRGGTIVNVTSTSGVRAIAGSGYYAASKFALEGFSEALAEELSDFDVTVMAVEPGAFDTDFHGRSRAFARRVIPEYTTVAVRRAGALGHGVGPTRHLGDPVAGARAILKSLEAPNPPRHLLLGGDAVRVITRTLGERIDQVRAWASLSRSSDPPDRDAPAG